MNKNFFSKIVISFFVFFFFFWVKSISAEFKSTDKKTDNITFSWTDVENALIYKIDYWTNSSNLNNSTDYIDWLEYKIFDLTPWTQYYFSLVWYDENWKDIYKSSNLTVSTLEAWSNTLKALSVEKAEMIWKNIIEVSFSNEISDKDPSSREFMIENVNNSDELIDVIKSEISKTNKKNLVLTLEENLKIWNSYKVTVLNIRDILNQNIEFWVNSEAILVAKELEEKMPELNSAAEEKSPELDMPVESLSGEILVSNWDLAWVDLNSAWIDPSVLTEATDASKLPQTWPESILVLLLAIIFSWIFFAYRFKKV